MRNANVKLERKSQNAGKDLLGPLWLVFSVISVIVVLLFLVVNHVEIRVYFL